MNTSNESISKKEAKNIKNWFIRLKKSIGAESDSDLAKKLNMSQQALAGSKNNDILPGSWIKKLTKKNISIDYIIYGERLIEGPEELIDNENKIKPICIDNIAEAMVRMVLQKREFFIDEMQVAVLVSVVKKNILPVAEKDLVELIRDFIPVDDTAK